MDSLDEVELVMAFEEEFVIEVSDGTVPYHTLISFRNSTLIMVGVIAVCIADAEKVHSVADAVELIARTPHAK